MNTIKTPTTPEPDTVAIAKKNSVPWNPWLAVIFVLAVYFVSQIIGGLALSVYPWLHHWGQSQSNNWVNNSVIAQFVYVLIAEAFTIGAIYAFLRRHKLGFGAIALHRPRWRDPLYGLLALPVYYIFYILAIKLVTSFIYINVNQQQNIGFTNVHGIAQLTLTFISLVILPPLTEEIMVRGFLYTSLKKGMPQIAAVIVTSAIFASAHLPEGGAAGPLWIAAVDTFTLSIVLIYLREKTNNLWASMTLHALKNGIAFWALFILNVH